MADDIYIATETVLTNHEGNEVYIVAGQTTVRAGHPLMRGRAALFAPLKVTYDLGDDVPGRPIPAASVVDAMADPTAAEEPADSPEPAADDLGDDVPAEPDIVEVEPAKPTPARRRKADG